METRRRGRTLAHDGQKRCGLALEAGMRLGTGRMSSCLSDGEDDKMLSAWTTVRMGQDAGGTDGRRGND